MAVVEATPKYFSVDYFSKKKKFNMNKSAQKKLALFEQLNADFENKLFTYRQSMDRYALSQSNPTATATMRERTKKKFWLCIH